MKNGPEFGEEDGEGAVDLSWSASASICEKSGLIVPLRVRFGVKPHRTVAPSSISGSPPSMGPSGSSSRVSVRDAVRVGTISRLRAR